VPPLNGLLGGAGSGIASPLPPTNDPKRRPRGQRWQFSQINRQYIAATLRQPIPQFGTGLIINYYHAHVSNLNVYVDVYVVGDGIVT
jgi:hypothetical protein